MNLLLLLPAEVAGESATIEGRRARHVLDVLSKQPGDHLRIGVLGEGVGAATVVEADRPRGQVRVQLGPRQALPRPTTSLILALPRPKGLSRIVQLVASFGVRHVDLIAAHKVDPAYFSSPRLHPERLGDDALLGLEQGGLVHQPSFTVHRSFGRFVTTLAERPSTAETRVVFHPVPGTHLGHVFAADDAAQPSDAVTLAFGPDGGFVPEELELLALAGFRAASLCGPILRTEVAVAAALGQLELLRHLAGHLPAADGS